MFGMETLSGILGGVTDFFGNLLGGGAGAAASEVPAYGSAGYDAWANAQDAKNLASVGSDANYGGVINTLIPNATNKNEGGGSWTNDLFKGLIQGGVGALSGIGGYLQSSKITPYQQAQLDYDNKALAANSEYQKGMLGVAQQQAAAAMGANSIAKKRNISEAYSRWAQSQNEAAGLTQKAYQGLGGAMDGINGRARQGYK